MIVLSYLGLLALIPLLVEKTDSEVQWHAKNGLLLMAADIAIWIILLVVSSLLGAITFGLGCLVSLLFPLLGIAILVVHIMAIVKGVNGGRLIIPGLSEYANRF
jgi:uncharacterized membrane protein